MAETRQQKQAIIDERRRKVASLYFAHLTQQEIATQLGVTQQLISLDLKAIRSEYRAERTEILDREAAELDHIERECALRYQRDKAGEWIDRRLKVKERRAKLLGLDAPAKVEASGPGGAPLRVEYVNDWRNAE